MSERIRKNETFREALILTAWPCFGCCIFLYIHLWFLFGFCSLLRIQMNLYLHRVRIMNWLKWSVKVKSDAYHLMKNRFQWCCCGPFTPKKIFTGLLNILWLLKLKLNFAVKSEVIYAERKRKRREKMLHYEEVILDDGRHSNVV